MKKFGENMSVQKKLMIGFLVLSVTIIGLSVTNWLSIISLEKTQEFLSEDTLPRIETLKDIELNIVIIQRCEKALLLPVNSGDEEEKTNQKNILNKSWQTLENDFQELKKLSHNTEGDKLWDLFILKFNVWKAEHGKVIEFINNNDQDSATEYSEDQTRTAVILAKKANEEVIKFNKKLVDSTKQESKRITKRNKLINLIGSIIAVLFSIVYGWFASMYLKNSLLKIYVKISEAVIKALTAVAEVSASSNQVADGASNQAASLEEVSSSLEETSAMTRNNAENASKADVLMHSIREKISGTSNDMKLLKKSMEEIALASAETQKIVKTIDEIAFQTNLLALNAAVEAARAGEAG
ncbi:MAG: hypothetical protein ACD_49C00093G0001, partial [uncultured bacterium (gcode 4)]